MEPPYFQDKRTSFWVIFRNHTLITPKAIEWLKQFARLPLNDRQRLALIYLQYRHQITNSEYQRLNCVDSVTSNRELRSLVQCDLVEQKNTRRWAYYISKIADNIENFQINIMSDEEAILEYVKKHGYIKNSECQKLLNINSNKAQYMLQKMKEEKILQHVGSRKTSKYMLP